jgi:hypothetical protein
MVGKDKYPKVDGVSRSYKESDEEESGKDEQNVEWILKGILEIETSTTKRIWDNWQQEQNKSEPPFFLPITRV